ncbi:MAG: CRISPR-associated endoribonuclease Cas6 [bacterium]
MRLLLALKPLQTACTIPLNYAYYLSSAIYRWIEISSPSYERFLHEEGYLLEGTLRRFKHFCFSQLFIEHSRIAGQEIFINGSAMHWYISMPVEKSLQHLVIGMFESREFYIGNKVNRFAIHSVASVSDPQWQRGMKFKLLSPVTVSTMKEHNGKLQPHYLLPDDGRLGELLRSNIINKYISLYGEEPDDTEFTCTLDQRYIERKQAAGKRITTLTTIKQGLPEETRVRGFMCPLTIEGNPGLIRLAYESGLGEKGSMGFGMMEVV